MKVFISADIEGVVGTVNWPQLEKDHAAYAAACRQMTRETAAACEGAIAAGASRIVVNDAHHVGLNIDPDGLPGCVELIRGSSGNPFSMVYGIEEGFDAAMFVGYHAAAGRMGNPLSHTYTGAPLWIKLNGVRASEFTIYSYAAALAGVPSVLLTGDRMLCEDSEAMHPLLKTVAVKHGSGGAVTSLSPTAACDKIREAAKEALCQDLSKALLTLPEDFTFEICYKEHVKAARSATFPGFARIDDNTISMHTKDYYDILRAVMWVL